MEFSQWTKQLIGGEWREGSSERVYTDRNPFNDEPLLSIRLATRADLDAAYRAAQAAQREWQHVSPFERSAMMERATEVFLRHRDDIITTLQVETGSTYLKACIEFDSIIGMMKQAATYPHRMQGQIVPSIIPGKENRIFRVPVGVVGVIGPFNFPMFLAMRAVAPALACGNGVVLKPATETLVAGGLLIGKLFEEAGFPPGLLNVVVGSGSEIGDAFVEHPVPGVIAFTGSTEVGRRVGEICGRTLKRMALELGGNNVMIVLEDADVDKAAHAAAFGKFLHQGQICMALNRIIVHRKLYEPFLEAFKGYASRVKVGDPREQDTVVGPLINRKQVDRILDLIRRSVEQGARVVLEGKVEGNLMSPYILADVRNDMPIAREEIFGPVAAVIPVESEAEAIQVANDTEYGLSGSVHTGCLEHGVEVALQMETGMVHVNDQSVNDEPLIAFGGEKASGIGRYGGEWALHEFTTVKWVSVQLKDRVYPF